MLLRAGKIFTALAFIFTLMAGAAPAGGGNGVVKVKSAYSVAETVARVKQDVAAKGIPFFAEIDQSGLAGAAGIMLRPSRLLIFGNPPLGAQFSASNPDAGLDWPVRLLGAAGRGWIGLACLFRLRLDRRSLRHPRPAGAVRNGRFRYRFDHFQRRAEIDLAFTPPGLAADPRSRRALSHCRLPNGRDSRMLSNREPADISEALRAGPILLPIAEADTRLGHPKEKDQ